MRRLTIGVLWLVVACGDDGASSSDGSTSTTSTTSTTDTDTRTGSADTTATSNGPGTSDGSGTTTVGPACMNDAECTDPMSPVCDGMDCVPCNDGGDAACAAKDPMFPACAADGRCVQCTDVELSLCTGSTPACDQGTNACRACEWHSECPQSACHLAGPDVGACFDEVPVPVMTAMELANAISAIGNGQQGVVVVGGGMLSFQAIDVNPGAEVAIIAPAPVTILGGAGTGLTADVGSLVYASGLEIRNWTGAGVDANGDDIWLDRVVVAQNDQAGIDASNTNLVMRLSSVGRNGDTALASPGVSVSGGSVSIVYSSIVANQSTGPRSLVCVGASGTVRNSILVAEAMGSVACTGVTLTNNALDQMMANNANVGFMASWFVDFVAGDARLVGMPTMLQVASWEDADPITDFDGTDIPQMGMSYAGFDQP